MFKVISRNTRRRCEVCSKLVKTPERRRCKLCPKLTIEPPERRQRRIVNFEHISHFLLEFLFLNLNMLLPAGLKLTDDFKLILNNAF